MKVQTGNVEYAIVDIETTGGSARGSKITEIAIRIHDGKEVIERWESLVRPGQSIPTDIQALTGISREMVADAPTFGVLYVQTFLEANVPTPVGADIDMCYALGAGSRGNMFAMDGTGFSAFASAWQAAINAWDVRNVARLKLNRGEDALTLYEGLDENNRTQMIAAYENSSATASTRLSSLMVDDIILLHSSDRGLYVAMKVLATPPAVSGAPGNFTVEIKVSRP